MFLYSKIPLAASLAKMTLMNDSNEGQLECVHLLCYVCVYDKIISSYVGRDIRDRQLEHEYLCLQGLTIV